MINQALSSMLNKTLSAARAELTALPDVPGLELFLLNADFPQQALSREEMMAVMAEPSYWAFCWASGQVLAKFIVDNPRWVAGKRVLDFGCGSGVVAIAAAQAGAKEVLACDIDPAAIQATAINARQNEVDVKLYKDFYEVEGEVDLIIVADVLYDRENLPWLGRFIERAQTVLVADSRVKNFDYPPYQKIAEMSSSTLPDLDEFDEFRHVRIFAAQ
jgi:predicted nicotinamide N-methyase